MVDGSLESDNQKLMLLFHLSEFVLENPFVSGKILDFPTLIGEKKEKKV